MASLFDLPPELLNRVVDATDPSTSFNLALVNKLAFQRLQATIDYHKTCCVLRVTTDILPLTIPTLLKGGKPDAHALWHIRTIELWSSRSSWADWKVHELVYPDETPDDRRLKDDSVPERPYGPGHFTQDELDNFMMIMERDLHFDHSTAWKWRSSIEEGCDLALKGILVALCPRLQTLRLIYETGEVQELGIDVNGNGNSTNDNENNSDNINGIRRSLFLGLLDPQEDHTEITRAPEPHELFLRFIGKSARSVTSSTSELCWPAGLASLEHIAVGVCSKGREEEPHYDWLNASAVAPLFALPCTKSLYLAGLAPDDADAVDDVETGAADGSDDPTLKDSSVQKLFIDRSCPSNRTLVRFMEACNLTTLAFQNCEMEDFTIDDLQLGMPSDMEDGSLLHFSIMSCNARGYRSQLCYPDEFWPLSTIALEDLYLAGDIHRYKHPDPDLIVQFKEYLKCALEKHHGYISMLPSNPPNCLVPENVDEMELLDDALTYALRTAETSCRGIFLDNLDQGRSDKFAYRKSIMAGKSKGIEIITAATHISEDLQAMLPRGETDADIESSPWRNHPSIQNLVAHHSRGLEQAGCNSCGQCEVCYAKYPKELWDQRNRGEYFTMENFRKWRHEDRTAAIAGGYLEEEAEQQGDEDSDADSWEESDNDENDDDSGEESGDERSDEEDHVEARNVDGDGN